MSTQSGRWSHVSQLAKDLVTDMLHIAPQRRPTAAQLIKHPWLNRIPSHHQQCIMMHTHNPLIVETTPQSSSSSLLNDGKPHHLKEAVAATFRAIATSPQIAHLGPVAMSELARRRFKGRLQHQS